MSKRRRTNPSNKFVMLERWFLATPAWRALPHAARSLYVELELEYKGPGSCNNGKIKLSVRHAAERLSCSINFARTMFAELEGKGLIKVNQRGSFGWKRKHSTTWILTKHPCGSRPATSDFMTWKAAPENLELGITGRYRSVSRHDTEAPETDVSDITSVSRGDTEKADSDPLSVSRHDTVYSIPPVSPSKTASPKTKSNAAHMERPPPQAAAATSSDGSVNQLRGPRGSQAAKARWLLTCLQIGVVRVADVAEALKLEERDVGPIANGRTTIASTAWSKLAALVHGRMQ